MGSTTVQLIIAALGLAGSLAPYAIQGVEALVGAIKAHEASGTKLSLDELEGLASSHGVDLEKLAALLTSHLF